MRVHIVMHVFSYSKFHVLQTCLFLVDMLLTYFWNGINIGINATQQFLIPCIQQRSLPEYLLENHFFHPQIFVNKDLRKPLPINQYWNKRWIAFALSTFGHGKNFPRRLCFCQFLQINLLTEKAMSSLSLSSFSRYHFQP